MAHRTRAGRVAAIEIADFGPVCCPHVASSRCASLPTLDDGRDRCRARSDESYQRRVIVSITTKARRLFDEVAPESEAIYSTAGAREIGTQRLDRIYSLLDEVIGILARPRSR